MGRQVAVALAAGGHDLVLIARDRDRLAETAERVSEKGGTARVIVLDLAETGQVRALAGDLSADPPAVLVSNAAMVAPVDARNSLGVPTSLAVNHLAPYLLMRSLVEPAGARPTRFVIVGGLPSALRRTPVTLDDLLLNKPSKLGWPPSLRPVLEYGQTKNMNLMFLHGLHARLPAGSGVTVTGAHPGIISTTRLSRHDRGAAKAFGTLTSGMTSDTVEEAADRMVWLATAPELAGTSGEYFVGRESVDTPDHTRDPARIDRLWRASAQLVGLKP